MSAQHPEVSVIIVSYNTRELLRGCLESLRRIQDEVDFEVIVVDNASSDASAELVQRSFTDVQLVQSTENIGFASGINLGRKSANGDYLFVLNPDCLVPPSSLNRLLDFAKADSKRAVVGAHITTPDGVDLPSVFSIPTLFREFWNFLPELKSTILRWLPFKPSQVPQENSPQPRKVPAVSGAAFLVRTTQFDEVRGMDREFFLYHEELDFCTRIAKAGFEVWTVPDAQIIHFDAQATGYSTAKLARNPVLEWRVLGMDRLWRKHRAPTEHAKWRKLARCLLGFRVLGLLLKSIFSSKTSKLIIDSRIRELDVLKAKLTD